MSNVKCLIHSRFGIDYDPEDILEPLNDNNDRSDQESDNEESGARDHYLSVGKSKLRSEQPLLEDPRYAGKRTSRKDIYSDDDEEEEDQEFKGFPASDDDDEEDEEENDDSNDDDEDLLANAKSYEEEEDDSEADSDEQDQEDAESDAESAKNDGEDDEINTELRRIQEEEKYVLPTDRMPAH